MTKPTTFSTLLREPLLHFALLGALVFGVDAWRASREDNETVIRIGPAVHAELAEIFRGERGRDPNPDELGALRKRWLENEVLYREGIAMRLDRGDTAIRDRVIFKALNVAQANLELPPVDDTELERWFEDNRARYDEPERVDFLEAVIEGGSDRATVDAFAAALNAGADTDTQSGLRIFRGRPHASIVASFGENFAAGLATIELDTWHVLESSVGPRAVRIEQRTDAVPAAFNEVRGKVLADWRDRRMQELRADAVAELARKYKIEIDEPEPYRVARAAEEQSR